jgi:hypothetical protein
LPATLRLRLLAALKGKVMKRLMFLAAVALSVTGAQAKGGSHYVAPHVKKDGTYVEGHRQTNPNASKSDNWSSKGNTNPYTGKEGTKDPYELPPPKPLKPAKTKP